MPRGYLKHNKAAGKARLGGGSKKSKCHKGKKCGDYVSSSMYRHEKNEDLYHEVRSGMDEIDDEWLEEGKFGLSNPPRPSVHVHLQECPVCCEIRPLVKIMKGCSHEPICKVCLREIYINQAQQDVKNFPLKCYHPSCDRLVTHAQLQIHGLCKSEEEIVKHHRLHVLAKAYNGTRTVTHCPSCDFPQEIKHQETSICKNCGIKYEVEGTLTNRASTIQAIESIERDGAGPNAGWARCPKCHIIISKGWGCDHMTCMCGQRFNWKDAIAQKDNKAWEVKAAVIQRLGSM